MAVVIEQATADEIQGVVAGAGWRNENRRIHAHASEFIHLVALLRHQRRLSSGVRGHR